MRRAGVDASTHRDEIAVASIADENQPQMLTETAISSRMSDRLHGECFAAAEMTLMRSGSRLLESGVRKEGYIAPSDGRKPPSP